MPLTAVPMLEDTNSPQNAIRENEINSQDNPGGAACGKHTVSMGGNVGDVTDNSQETNTAGNALSPQVHSGLNGSISASRYIPASDRGFF